MNAEAGEKPGQSTGSKLMQDRRCGGEAPTHPNPLGLARPHGDQAWAMAIPRCATRLVTTQQHPPQNPSHSTLTSLCPLLPNTPQAFVYKAGNANKGLLPNKLRDTVHIVEKLRVLSTNISQGGAVENHVQLVSTTSPAQIAEPGLPQDALPSPSPTLPINRQVMHSGAETQEGLQIPWPQRQ